MAAVLKSPTSQMKSTRWTEGGLLVGSRRRRPLQRARKICGDKPKLRAGNLNGVTEQGVDLRVVGALTWAGQGNHYVALGQLSQQVDFGGRNEDARLCAVVQSNTGNCLAGDLKNRCVSHTYR